MKRPFVLVLALTALIGANLNLCCRVSVCANEVPGVFSPETINKAMKTAQLCAEEICPGKNEELHIEKSYTLSLKKPDGTAAQLSDAILEAMPEIGKSWCVYSNGRCLGTVESKAKLEERIRAYILNTMPDGAAAGNFSGEVRIEKVYTNRLAKTTEQDMVLLLSGAVPVIYTDEGGQVIAG